MSIINMLRSLLFLVIYLVISSSFNGVSASQNVSNFDFSELPLDTAAVRIEQNGPGPIATDLLWASDNCYKCLPVQLASLVDNNDYINVDTRWPLTLYFSYTNSTNPDNSDNNDNNNKKDNQVIIIASINFHFGEKGGYLIKIINGSQISLVEEFSPIDSFIPIYTAIGVLIGTRLFWSFLLYLVRQHKNPKNFIFKSNNSNSLSKSNKLETPLLYQNTNINNNNDTPEIDINNKMNVRLEENKYVDASFIPLPEKSSPASIFDSPKPNNLNTNNTDPNLTVNDPSKTVKKAKKRLRSLDAFRGMSLCIMIFVNYGGGQYWFFNHATWNGLTVADLVFPWFIWMMGVSMALSVESMSKLSLQDKMYKIIRRSIILFACGMFVNNGYEITHWRIPGVLQRFSISFLVVSLIINFTPRIRKFSIEKSFFDDITPFALEWLIILFFIFLHLIITFTLPVPGCPTGYLGPGGLTENGIYRNCVGGAARQLDWLIFGESHIYHGPTCVDLYNCVVDGHGYDPEGSLGSLTSIVMTYFGLQCGRILVFYKDSHREILKRWALWALLLGIIATGLCGGAKEGGVIPINKNLWSVSFITAMASMGFIGLSIYYILIDIWGIWDGTPFYYVGMNSILIYMGSETLGNNFPFSYNVASVASANYHGPLLLENLIAVSSWALVAFYCHECNFFLAI